MQPNVKTLEISGGINTRHPLLCKTSILDSQKAMGGSEGGEAMAHSIFCGNQIHEWPTPLADLGGVLRVLKNPPD